MFEDFDFELLKDAGFKEDSVREELVVPVLKRLGYSASGEHKIVRSEPLEHPFVHIGTTRHRINIFPDYQLAPAGKKAWVLDAKAPNQNIRSGPNVEQAFSYAIHRDVRVQLYALCNGHELVVFHVSELEARLAIPLAHIDAQWQRVHDLLCPLAFTNPKAIGFAPDFGLSIIKMGLSAIDKMYFPMLHFNYVGKSRDDLYTLTSTFEMGEKYCASFDLDPEMYAQFLEATTPQQRRLIKNALSQHPWFIYFEREDECPLVTVGAVMAGYGVKTDSETYAPLKVIEVRKPPGN